MNLKLCILSACICGSLSLRHPLNPKDVDYDPAAEAFQCCGRFRAKQYVESFPKEQQKSALNQLKALSVKSREPLLSKFVHHPSSPCKNDYDCNFVIENNGGTFDEHHCQIEHYNIDFHKKWIPKGAKVLEVGARYGHATCYIAKLVGASEQVVSVEADPMIWEAWETNNRNHKCGAKLLKGTLGTKPKFFQFKGYLGGVGGYSSKTRSMKTEDTEEVPSHTVDSLGKRFDTLVVDCEGCFETLLSENPGLEQMLNLIILEIHSDSKEREEMNRLLKNGWHLIEEDGLNGQAALSRSPKIAENVITCD